MERRAMTLKQASGWAGKGLLLLLAWLALGAMGAQAATTTTVTYVYTNAQGTPLAKANDQGTITARFTYRPYGTQQSGPTNDGPGYTGHVHDPETGLVYMQQRYYDPEVGRFISPDPIAPKPGNVFNFNRFAYANNNPIVNIDPSGTTCKRSGSTGSYSCQIDSVRSKVNGKMVTRQATAADHKKYKAVESSLTKAVNSAAKSGKTENISFNMGGKTYSFSISGSAVSKSLAKRMIVINPASKGAMGTVGNTTIVGKKGINPGKTIYGDANRTRSMEFLHEGIHNTSEEMSSLGKSGSIFMGTHQNAHQKAYNEAASDLLWPIP